MIEIKHKTSGKVLMKVKAENLAKADLSGANLSEAKGIFIFNHGVKLQVMK